MSTDLSISTYSLLKWRLANKKTMQDTVDWIAKTGVKKIELTGVADTATGNTLKQAALMRKHCTKRKLKVASYCTGAELLLSPAKLKEAVATLKEQVQVAATLGAPSMRHDVTGGFERGYARFKGAKTFTQALKIVVPAIREVADYAQTLGVKTSLENHGFFMQAPGRVTQLIDTVNHPNFGLTMDMGNFLCVDADPVDAVKQCVKYAQMVHIKDFQQKLKKQMPPIGWFATPTRYALRGSILGHGIIDLPAQLKLLKRAKYSGVLSLEYEGIEEPAFGVQTGLDYLRGELEKLGMLA